MVKDVAQHDWHYGRGSGGRGAVDRDRRGSTAAIYLFLLVLLRLFGRRQLGQLTVIDLVVVLLLGQRGRDRHDPRPRRRTGGDPGDRRVGERHPPHRPRSGARRAGPEA
jgi:hypothetical protein